MASASSSLCSPMLSFKPFSETQMVKPKKNPKVRTQTWAMRREGPDQNHRGRAVVDENLIVLRKRIHEMKKTMERDYEAPAEWMDWEKTLFYSSYDSIICDAMRLLQSYLMTTRPGLALGFIALIALSVPTSAAVVVFNCWEFTRGVVVAGIHPPIS